MGSGLGTSMGTPEGNNVGWAVGSGLGTSMGTPKQSQTILTRNEKLK